MCVLSFVFKSQGAENKQDFKGFLSHPNHTGASAAAHLMLEGPVNVRDYGAPTTIDGRDVVPNVLDLFGGIGAQTIGADVAQGTARVNSVIVSSRVAKK